MSPDDWVLAIPSYNRVKVLCEKTIKLIEDQGVDRERVTIFVTADQFAFYQDALPKYKLAVTPVSMRAARNTIARHYAVGTPILEMDDDIRGLVRKTADNTLVPLSGLTSFVSNAFWQATEENCALWGIYPVANGLFMKDTMTTDLRYIVGAMFGVTYTGNDDVDLVTLDDKEDFERTCRFYLHSEGVARFNYVAPKTSYYNTPGGMQSYRSKDTVTHGVEQMLQLFPNLCSVNTRKKSDWPEVKLKDRRPR